MNRLVFVNKLLPLFVLSLLVALSGFFVGVFFLYSINNYFFLIFIVEIILIFLIKKVDRFKLFFLFLFVFISGLSLTPLIFLVVYNYESGIFLVLKAFFITFISFFSFVLYVFFTKRNFLKLGNVLLPLLFGLIVSVFINYFFNFSFFSIVYDSVSLILFLLFVLFDTSKILRIYDDDEVVDGVLSYYLDFINLFITILRIFSRKKK